MKKFWVVMLVCLTVLQTGCIYQASYRPNPDDNEIWVCENPRMEFYFGEEKREREDVIFINGKKHFIIKHPDAGPIFTVEERNEEDEVDPYVDRENPEKFLFRGDADYKKDHFDIKVTDDYVNLFGGELPTLHFEKRDIDEYFAEVEKAE